MKQNTLTLLFVGVALSLSVQSFAQFKPFTRADEEGGKREKAVRFFRVNNPEERLYEDANSIYSKGKGLNFLGVEGKGDSDKNTAIQIKYARGKVMPQYLVMLNQTIEEGTEEICPVCNDPECTHSKVKTGYTNARFLVNLKDSVELYKENKAKQDIFLWNGLTRLAFVDGRIYGDSLLVIQNSSLEAKKDTINFRKVNENGEGDYNSALFSFRLLTNDPDGIFMIESWCKGIGDYEGEWIKIQNGVPVIVETTIRSAKENDAEIFDVEYTTDEPVNTIEINNRIRITSGEGTLTILNASGKTVQISNLLGQNILSRKLTSDESVFSVPSGVAVVSIEGEEAQKILIK